MTLAPELLEILGNDPVVAVSELARRDTFVVGLHEDRSAVLVGAADHQHVVAGQPPVAADDVRRHTETGHVTDVTRAVGIRPRDSGEDVPAHGSETSDCVVDESPG